MKISRFYEWLYLKRQDKKREMEWQAALHGAKIKGDAFGGMPLQKPHIQGESALQIAQMFGGKIGVKRVKVSPEELARRAEASKQ
ncbi:MAG: hypothetical protein ACE5I1_11430 [bacterium]